MNLSSELYEEAAAVFLKLQDPDISPEEIESSFCWIDASPLHASAFEQVKKTWHDESSKTSATPAVVIESLPKRLPRYIPTTVLRLVGVIVAILLFGSIPSIVKSPQQYATKVGEIRTIDLPDGSTMQMGGASTAVVNFTSSTRHIDLLQGEALFKVAKNLNRPFVVGCAGGTTRAVGTQFNVHRNDESVSVAVLEGVVQVQNSQTSAGVRLSRGFEATYSRLTMTQPQAVNLDDLASWRSGQFTFRNQPLGAVIADLNRYSLKSISVSNESIKKIRITGSVTASGIAEWLDALPEAIPVSVNQLASEIVISPAISSTRHAESTATPAITQ